MFILSLADFLRILLSVVWKVPIGNESRDSSVGIATEYGQNDRGSIPKRSKSFSSTPQRPNQLWGPPILLFNGYGGLFPRGESGRDVKLTSYLNLVPRSRKTELYGHFPYVSTAWCLINYKVKHGENVSYRLLSFQEGLCPRELVGVIC
jgi:hypothetical protein